MVKNQILKKNKRKLASTGRIKTPEECKKLSENNKGRIPWNKGLSKETDDRVLKNSINSKNNKKEFIKIYILKYKDITLSFNGRENLKKHIINLNKVLKKNTKISINNLIKNKENRGFTISF